MTIGNPASNNRAQINGNGVTSSASIDWSFWDQSDLRVIHTDSDGVDTVWSYGASPGSWAFTGGDGSTGTVTFTAADLATGERLTIIPAEKLDQPVDLNSGNISQSAMEEAVDKLAARIQREAERVDRAVKLKESTTHTSGIVIELPTEGAAMIGGPDGALVNGPTADQITSAQQYASDASDAKDAAETAQAGSESARDAAVVAQDAAETAQGLAEDAASQLGIAQFGVKSDLEAATVLASQKSAEISGYTTAGDGGGALYKRVDAEPSHAGKIRSTDRYLSSGTVDATNGGWWEIVANSLSVKMFGAAGDEDGNNTGTDNTDAFDAVAAISSEIYVPQGGYKVTKTYAAYNFTGPGVVWFNGTQKIYPLDRKEPGEVVQSVWGDPYTDNTDLTAAIPLDNTPPRSTEGTEIIDASIIKKHKNSSILVEFNAQATADVAGTSVIATLFVSQSGDIYTDETSARSATFVTVPAVNYGVPLRLCHQTWNADGNDYVYSIRVGPSANTARLNGITNQTRFYGGSAATLRLTEIAGEVITWGGEQGSGVLEGRPSDGTQGISTEAPDIDNYTVSTPDGNTPVEADLDTHRYRHHTKIAEHNGNVWVANSSGGTNEDAGGQMTVVQVSDANTVSFSSPMLVMPAQSAFSGTGASQVVGTRISYPSCFVVHDSKLYLIAAVDEVQTGPTGQGGGVFLGAVECLDNKTTGSLFRITPDAYSPAGGAAAVSYDATLGPALLAKAVIYGTWGDSSGKATDWETFKQQGSKTFNEPSVIDVDGDESFLIKVWRRTTAPNEFVYASYSKDGGATWSEIRKTDIPNTPAHTAGCRLPDGRLALVGNLRNQRDPLYLAVFDPVYRVRDDIYYVRAGLPGSPTYAGTYKDAPSAAYPGVWVGETYLWVSYSISKEDIGASRIPLASL